LLKIGDVDAAFTDILGSNLFSCVIMAFIDLIAWKVTSNNMWSHEAAGAINILFWFIMELIMLGGILLVNYNYRRNKKKPRSYYVWLITLLVLLLCCYIISVVQEAGYLPKIANLFD
jgi:Ca2+/Na+ antiporter